MDGVVQAELCHSSFKQSAHWGVHGLQTKKRGQGKSFYRALFLLSPHTFAGLITIFALTMGVAHAWVADLIVLDGSAQPPLKAATNADIVKTLNLLRKQMEANGTTRIIVGLRIDFASEGGLTAVAVAQQRNEIARMQSVVLEKVPSLKQKPEQIKRYATSPFMALEVNAAELEALFNLSEIVSIEADRLAAPAIGIEVVIPESK